MTKLTNNQIKVLTELSTHKLIYVFHKGDKASYGYDLEDTSNRLYLTLTCRSLVNKGLCTHVTFDDKEVLKLTFKSVNILQGLKLGRSNK